MQLEALDVMLDDYGVDRAAFPPALVAAAVQGLAFVTAHDEVARFDTAREEAAAATTRLVDQLEARRAGAWVRRGRSGRGS